MEILGGELDLAFEELGIHANKTYESENKEFQVWELTDEEFGKLINVSEDNWKDEYGWWREGRCIYEGAANTEYIVNGQTMLGYSDDHTIELDRHEGKYKSYTDWLSEVMDLSTTQNVSIFAMSLAADNNMKLAEFMTEFQP